MIQLVKPISTQCCISHLICNEDQMTGFYIICNRVPMRRSGSFNHEVPGTNLIDYGRVKGRVYHGATQWFWSLDLWIGNQWANYCLFCVLNQAVTPLRRCWLGFSAIILAEIHVFIRDLLSCVQSFCIVIKCEHALKFSVLWFAWSENQKQPPGVLYKRCL